MDTLERVIRVIKDVLNPSLYGEVRETSRLEEDLYMDPLDSLDIVEGLEEEFKIKITDSEMCNSLTVADLVTVINGKV